MAWEVFRKTVQNLPKEQNSQAAPSGPGLKMDVALEKLIARTEGARRRRRISQVKGQSKGDGPERPGRPFLFWYELDSAAARPALFASARPARGPQTLGKEGNIQWNKY